MRGFWDQVHERRRWKVPSAFLVRPLERLGVLTTPRSLEVLIGWGLQGPEQTLWSMCEHQGRRAQCADG